MSFFRLRSRRFSKEISYAGLLMVVVVLCFQNCQVGGFDAVTEQQRSLSKVELPNPSLGDIETSVPKQVVDSTPVVVAPVVQPTFPSNMMDRSVLPLPVSLQNHAPLNVSSFKNGTYSGLRISNPSGPCLVFDGVGDVVIERNEIGPCQGPAIVVKNSVSVTIRENFISGVQGGASSIEVYNSSWMAIERNLVNGGASSVYVVQSKGVSVRENRLYNVQGPFPRGQFVQFNGVTGPYNEIKCNMGENILGQSYAEDAINVFRSQGTAESFIHIYGNRIRGGGPSKSGGGIMVGDGGDSSFIRVQQNILVDPGQYGLGVSGGSTIDVFENLVYAKSQPFTNVGIYVWNQYASSCSNISVFNNRTYWFNSAGERSPFWNHGNCGPVGGWDNSNSEDAQLSESIIHQKAAGCNYL